jgi:hypothetical protein
MKLSLEQQSQLLSTLQTRFDKNRQRHQGLDWSKIQQKLEENPRKLQILFKMEETQGEPDVIGYDKTSDEYIFCDCSPESPKGRRSLCYDQQALDSRKENKPQGSAVAMASEIGIDLLDEAQYRELQKLEKFDTKTSSWIKTPDKIRALGGALFCDLRYDTVFTYHNGAESYYAARGFRGILKV